MRTIVIVLIDWVKDTPGLPTAIWARAAPKSRACGRSVGRALNSEPRAPVHLRPFPPPSAPPPPLARPPSGWMSPAWDAPAPLSRSTASDDRGNTSSFPIPTAAQYASINAVIRALPRDTDSWLPLDETCHRLDIDEGYLPLFLKLGLERGANWREKWDNAQRGLRERGVELGAGEAREGKSRRVQSEESSLAGGQKVGRGNAGAFELLKAKVESVKAVASPRRATTTSPTQPLGPQQPPSRASPATTTPRDAPAASRPKPAAQTTREFLVAPRAGYVSSSDDYAGVPSFPSTKHRSSKPSYPLQSTPAAASRASSSHTPLVDSAISSARATGKRSSFPPPLPQQAQTSSPALDQYLDSRTTAPRQQSVSFQAAPDENMTGSIASGRLTSALESRADDFRRLSLLSSAWFAWQTNLSNLHLRQEQIDQARRAVLARWAITKWRAKRSQLDELEERGWRVQRAREDALVQNALVAWGGALASKRRRQWEDGLRAAWDTVRGRWKEKVARECFEVSAVVAARLAQVTLWLTRGFLSRSTGGLWRSSLRRCVSAETCSCSTHLTSGATGPQPSTTLP